MLLIMCKLGFYGCLKYRGEWEIIKYMCRQLDFQNSERNCDNIAWKLILWKQWHIGNWVQIQKQSITLLLYVCKYILSKPGCSLHTKYILVHHLNTFNNFNLTHKKPRSSRRRNPSSSSSPFSPMGIFLPALTSFRSGLGCNLWDFLWIF